MVLLLYGRMVEKIDQPINRCQRGFGRAHYLAGNIKQCVCEFLIAVVKTLAHEDQNTDNQARQATIDQQLDKGYGKADRLAHHTSALPVNNSESCKPIKLLTVFAPFITGKYDSSTISHLSRRLMPSLV